MNNQETKVFFRKLLTDLFEQQNVEKVQHYFDEKVVGFHLDQEIDFEGVLNHIKDIKEHIRSIRIEIVDLLVEEKRIAIYTKVYLQKSHKSQPQTIPIMGFYYLENNKIIKFWSKEGLSH